MTNCNKDKGLHIPDPGDYSQLVWMDDFQDPEIDLTIWKFDSSHYWDHGEIQHYAESSKNAFIENGKLVIRAREEFDSINNTTFYTSACITSLQEYGLEYGRLDIRAKMPFGRGVISGFTMKPAIEDTDTSMANAIEIAVVKGGVTNRVMSNIRYFDNDGIPRYSGDWYAMKEYNDFSRDFHTYSIIKEKGEIWFYVNGKMYHHVSKNGVIPSKYPFDETYSLNLHVAVGGIWAGKTDSLLTPFPQDLEIDHVKVYKRSNTKNKTKFEELTFPDLKEYDNLAWSDEFDRPTISSTYWTHETGDLWWNNEIQSYTSDSTNSYIEDDCLVIRAMEKPDHVNSNRNYTSARLITKDKFTFGFGRIDFKIKVDNGSGVWPAAWLLPNEDKFGVWPASGEIDVMEIFGTDSLTQYMTVHFGTNRADHRTRGKKIHVPGGFNDEFHLYTLVKEKDHLWWYFDGKPCFHTSKKLCLPHHYPFNEEFYIVLNMAIGGGTAGYPDDNVVFPKYMHVDHVRVYTK
jgi:beta-glucanase (GH16 family)